MQRAREAARRAQCLNQLKQIGVASEAFYSQHQRYATGIIPFASQNTPRHGEVNYSPHFQLLPFLDQGELQNRFDDRENGRGTESDPPTSTVNAELLETRLAIFECPSDPARRPLNSYRICSGTSPHLGESSGLQGCVEERRNLLPGLARAELRAAMFGIREHHQFGRA